MMRRLSILALAGVPVILAAGFPASLHAQTTPLTAFDIGASPNPVGDGFFTTLTAFVLGSSNSDGTYIAPDDSVTFYVSSNSVSCSPFTGAG